MAQEAGKVRWATFDGLRGLAALFVMLHHTEDFTTTKTFGHGYIAVDLFFMLGGIVIAQAYEPKLRAGVELRTLARQRLIRLVPLTVLGILLGALWELVQGTHPVLVAYLALAQTLFVPMLFSFPDAYTLNGAQWSLFFELVMNGLHAVLLVRLSERTLARLLAALLPLMLLTAWAHGSLDIGSRANNFMGGLPRAAFAYVAGVLLFRLHTTARLPLLHVPWPLLAVTLVGAMMLPVSAICLWLLDPLIVALLFPAMLVAALHMRLHRPAARCAAWLGGLSFPLYSLHLPVFGLVRLATPIARYDYAAVGAPLLALLAAWAAQRWLDNPLQRRLRARPDSDASPPELALA